MSGRDVEPVAAFFPSIDRNLMRDLDRQLRGSQPAEPQHLQPAPASQPAPHQEQARSATRPTVDTIVEAVEHAASTIASMVSRIHDLETALDEAQTTGHETLMQLGETSRRHDMLEATLRAERERGERAETLAAHHIARANRLDLELATALGDLTRVTEAIALTLGLPDRAAP